MSSAATPWSSWQLLRPRCFLCGFGYLKFGKVVIEIWVVIESRSVGIARRTGTACYFCCCGYCCCGHGDYFSTLLR